MSASTETVGVQNGGDTGAKMGQDGHSEHRNGDEIATEKEGQTLRHSSRIRKPSRRAEEMLEGEEREAKAAARSSHAAASRSLAKADEDDNKEDDNDDQSSDDEVYCVCRKKDTGTPMVLCAECEDWFHFKCVGLSKKSAESIVEFICPGCEKSTGKKSKANNDDTDAPKSNVEDQEQESKTDEAQEAATKRKRDDSTLSRKKAKPSPLPQTKHSPTPAPLRSPNSASSPRSPAAPVKASQTQAARKASLTGATASSSSSPSRSASTSLTVIRTRSDALRKHAVAQFTSIFAEIFPQDAQSADEESRAALYAQELEKSMFDATSEVAPKVNLRIADKAYRDRLRTLLFNLKDKTNVALRSRIADGALPAQALSSLGNEELANDSMRQEREQRKREALEQSIMKKDAAPLRKLTHKGEIDIEYENAQQRAATDMHEQQAHTTTKRRDKPDEKMDEDKTEKQEGPHVKEQAMSPKPPGPSTMPRDRLPSAEAKTGSLQSPTLPFDFSNVWQGEGQAEEDAGEDIDENEFEGGDVSIMIKSGREGHGDVDATEEGNDGEHAEQADNFIDDFLGMGDGDENAVLKSEVANEQAEQAASATLPAARWRGSMHMPDEGAFSCAARQVAGRPLEDAEWHNLFPTPHALIEGRLPSSSAIPYLLQSRTALRTELVAFMVQQEWVEDAMKTYGITTPQENQDAFVRMVNYFQTKDRYGVLQGNKAARGKTVKDFYLAALPSGAPTPQWLDLLADESKSAIDEVRNGDVFLLVAVLFKQHQHQPSATSSHPAASNAPAEAGRSPSGNLSAMLGQPGSTTLQDLLRAVGGGSTARPTNSGMSPSSASSTPIIQGGMQSPPNESGAVSSSLAGQSSNAYAPGQMVPASSVEALGQLPKTQLEDVLTKNPTLVDDLLKTLGKSSASNPGGSFASPPGPPPPRPPGMAPHPFSAHAAGPPPPEQPMYSQPYGSVPYAGNAYPPHYGGGEGMAQGYPSSGFPAQAAPSAGYYVGGGGGPYSNQPHGGGMHQARGRGGGGHRGHGNQRGGRGARGRPH